MPKITPSKFFFFLRRYFLNVFVEKFRNPYANPWWLAKYNAKMTFKSIFSKLFYSKPNLNEKYFYYPLHQEEDAQLLVLAPQYADQYYLVKFLSNTMPSGYKIYVKEHAANIGGMSSLKIRKMSKLPNVKVISPFVNSHTLIENAACVITINSTVGFEAILHGKPLIALGDCFYDIAGMSWNIRDISQLPKIMKNALKQKLWSREKMLRFVNAFLTTLNIGNRNFYEGFEREAFKKENISLLADQIYKEVNERIKTAR